MSGTVALMLQANPQLTPNLEGDPAGNTSQVYSGYDWLTQGAGFLNARGAVVLADYFREVSGMLPEDDRLGATLIWGNHRVSGGVLTPGGTAWGPTSCGASSTLAGQNVVWGENCDQVGTCESDNVVWGNSAVWGTDGDDNVVWSNTDGDNVVWGNGNGDNITWGENDTDNVVWGNADDNVVVQQAEGTVPTTSSGATAMKTTLCGATPKASTTSCGVTPPMSPPSGARATTTHHLGQRRRRRAGAVWR